MAANLIYNFSDIAPGSTVSLFIHGYGNRDAVTYCVVPYNVFTPGVLFPQGHVTLTQGETFRWAVNGTVARKIYITNHSPFERAVVDVIEMKESF
jgi:hypothetical protein